MKMENQKKKFFFCQIGNFCLELGRKQVWSESPCPAALCQPTSLFFLIHPRWRFSINDFYLKSSHKLKSICGTIIIVNNNKFDFKSGRGSESHM